MALHTELPIYKVAYDLLDAITDLAKNMPRDFKPWRRVTRRRTFNEALSRTSQMPADELFETANSYFGLLRQATHSHRDRARLANVLRHSGHCINKDFAKTYRKSNAQ